MIRLIITSLFLISIVVAGETFTNSTDLVQKILDIMEKQRAENATGNFENAMVYRETLQKLSNRISFNPESEQLEAYKTIELAVVKSAIQDATNNYTRNVTDEQFKGIANDISGILWSSGSEKMYRHVIVMRSNDTSYYNYYICPVEHCHLITKQYGVDIMITRGYKDDMPKAMNLTEAEERGNEALFAYLEFHYDLQNFCHSAKRFATRPTQFENATSVVMINKRSTFFQSCSTFPTVDVPYSSDTMYHIYCDNKQEKGIFMDNHCWSVYFFDYHH